MSDPIESFMGTARSIRLEHAEKDAAKRAILAAVRTTVPSRHTLGMDEHTLLSSASKIALEPAERARIRSGILEHLHGRHTPWFLVPLKHLTSLTAALLIVILAGGTGMAAAAEKSMPGDVLYPIKMHVNETLRMRMAATPSAKMAIALDHAERRLHEAEVLAEKQALSPDTATMLALEMDRNVGMVQQHVEEMMHDENLTGASEVSMNLEATLRAHGRLLERLRTKNDGTVMDPLLESVHKARMASAETAIVAAMHEPKDMASAAEEQHSIRQAKEHAVAKAETPEPAPAAPAAVMMKAMPVADESITAAFEDDAEDIEFDTEVRMHMTTERVRHIEERLSKHSDPLSDDHMLPIETRMQGSQFLMDMAAMHREEGNGGRALEASDAALRHAEKAAQELETLLPEREE